jgi:hypothetical protein
VVFVNIVSIVRGTCRARIGVGGDDVGRKSVGRICVRATRVGVGDHHIRHASGFPPHAREVLEPIRRRRVVVEVAAEVRHGQSPGSQTGVAVRLFVRVVRKHPCVCRRLGKRRRRAADARGQFAINTFGRAFVAQNREKKNPRTFVRVSAGVRSC